MREEYMVEVYFNGEFSHQIDVFNSEALAMATIAKMQKAHMLDPGEAFHLTTVRYENGNEVSMESIEIRDEIRLNKAS